MDSKVAMATKHDFGKLSTSKTSSGESEEFKTTPRFKEMQKKFEADGKTLVKQVKGIILFDIRGPGGKTCKWTVDAKNEGSVTCGTTKKPNCTITISDDDLLGIMEKRLDAKSAYFGGKLKISGNMGLAMKLPILFATQSKL